MNLVDPNCSLGGTALCWQPFGFAGGVWDVTTGVVRFGARDYDPGQRRWTQKDPIGFKGSQENIYDYIGDDPVNGDDPSGEGTGGSCESSPSCDPTTTCCPPSPQQGPYRPDALPPDVQNCIRFSGFDGSIARQICCKLTCASNYGKGTGKYDSCVVRCVGPAKCEPGQ